MIINKNKNNIINYFLLKIYIYNIKEIIEIDDHIKEKQDFNPKACIYNVN